MEGPERGHQPGPGCGEAGPAGKGGGGAEAAAAEGCQNHQLREDGGEPCGDERPAEERGAGQGHLWPAQGATDPVKPVDRAERGEPEQKRQQDAQQIPHGRSPGICAASRLSVAVAAR